MGNATRVLRMSPMILLAALIVVAVVMALGASRTVAGPGDAQMPARVQNEGLTAQEEIQRQIDLTGRLVRDLPSASELRQVRIVVGQDEIDAIDHADKSSVPLKVGLVKAMTPAVEVNGLDLGPGSNLPRRGTSGLAIPTRDGGYVWALSVNSDQAGGIRLHIENLALPKGVELYVYSRTGEAYGPYTGTGMDESGEFWAPAVFGREAIVQVMVPRGSSLRDVTFRITEAGIITQKAAGDLSMVPEATSFCGNPECIVDASCYPQAASIWNAYAKQEWISGAWIFTCTGGLLNDSNPTLNNFFLTANHCYSKAKTAGIVSFYWWFRTSSCNGTCPINTGWPYKTTGATLRSTSRYGDYTLVTLNTAPPSGSVWPFSRAAFMRASAAAPPAVSANHTRPAPSTATPPGLLMGVEGLYSSNASVAGSNRAILLPCHSLNHTIPSMGLIAVCVGWPPAVGTSHSREVVAAWKAAACVPAVAALPACGITLVCPKNPPAPSARRAIKGRSYR